MRELALMPSLRSLAYEVVSAFEMAQVVLVQFPTRESYDDWIQLIVDACNNELQVRDEESIQPFEVSRDRWSPCSMKNELTFAAETSFKKFLAEYGPSPIHISLAGEPEDIPHLDEWSDFIKDSVQTFKEFEAGARARYLLVTHTSSLPLGYREGPNCRVYQLWNPITWEELRLAAAARIGSDVSDISRSWMVATYTAACCSSPRLLEQLCVSRPQTLRGTFEIALDFFGTTPRMNDGKIANRTSFGRRGWVVQECFEPNWREGAQIGATLERGMTGPPLGTSSRERQASIERRIWQEQVAGLFPIVSELSWHTMGILNRWLPKDWQQTLSRFMSIDVADCPYTEPAKVLDFLRQYQNLSRALPRTALDLLYSLRRVRNDIAHLRPVDLRDVAGLWDLYHRAVDQTSARSNPRLWS